MRPVTITFSGLRSYRNPATIEFSDLDLFAVTATPAQASRR